MNRNDDLITNIRTVKMIKQGFGDYGLSADILDALEKKG